MGWYYLHEAYTKRHLIRILTEETEYTKTLAKCVRGNVLWAVHESKKKEGERYIYCYLLQTCEPGMWGYKDMEENMGPYFYSCPLKYLDMAPVQHEGWRESVRAYHARRQRPYCIKGLHAQDEEGYHLYWSNEFGWCGRDQADWFSTHERKKLRLPINGVWIKGR